MSKLLEIKPTMSLFILILISNCNFLSVHVFLKCVRHAHYDNDGIIYTYKPYIYTYILYTYRIFNPSIVTRRT